MEKPKNASTLLNQGISQIAMVVEDLDKTVKNYWNTFWIGPWHFYTYKRPLLNMSRYHGQAQGMIAGGGLPTSAEPTPVSKQKIDAPAMKVAANDRRS